MRLEASLTTGIRLKATRSFTRKDPRRTAGCTVLWQRYRILCSGKATAYLGKRGRMKGGFGVEACGYIQEYGIVEEEYLPEFTKTFRWSDDAKENARKHKLVDFEELPKNSMESVVDAILCERCPVTVAFSWWRHLVCCVGVVVKGDDFGLICVNSWGSNWGDNGYTTLWGKKAVPYESVAVRQVRSREETNDE